MDNSQLACPLCGNTRTGQKRLGFVIYVCEEHGTWLFKGVLQDMLWKFSRADSAMLDHALKENEELRREIESGGMTE